MQGLGSWVWSGGVLKPHTTVLYERLKSMILQRFNDLANKTVLVQFESKPDIHRSLKTMLGATLIASLLATRIPYDATVPHAETLF